MTTLCNLSPSIERFPTPHHWKLICVTTLCKRSPDYLVQALTLYRALSHSSSLEINLCDYLVQALTRLPCASAHPLSSDFPPHYWKSICVTTMCKLSPSIERFPTSSLEINLCDYHVQALTLYRALSHFLPACAQTCGRR